MSKLMVSIQPVTEELRQEMIRHDNRWMYSEKAYYVEVVGGVLDGDGWFFSPFHSLEKVVRNIKKRELIKVYGRIDE